MYFALDAVSLRDLRKASEPKQVMAASVDQTADATLATVDVKND